jgi:hypothetical protein
VQGPRKEDAHTCWRWIAAVVPPAIDRHRTAKLGLKTEIAFDGKGGALTIHYQSLEQLDDLIAKLG